MAEMRQCKHCGQGFRPRPQNPDQRYCSEPACQRARKRNWQQQKMLSDADYQANQREAQQCWQEKTSDYWRGYRARNPDYTSRNRERQRERNRRRRERNRGLVPIAKMDASMPERSIIPGRYQLSRVDGGLIAKMDAFIVEINVISGS